ncbi:MAG: homoserine kinase [Proteobacteria bacterium]|nr:homoserine kinase [Pseudomonadota bacterium]
MAVFTSFSEESLKRYLIMFDRGDLVDCQPIEGGIENSNYFVTLDKAGAVSTYVLSIMENHDFGEVPFFTRLLAHLQRQNLPVAAPVMTLDGMTSTIFCGKPTLLFPCLAGEHVLAPDESHCEEIGRFIARSHTAVSDLAAHRDNPYSPSWMEASLSSVTVMDTGTRRLLTGIIEEYRSLLASDLPRGVIHGDLFRDNALFDGNRLCGVIDYYHACHDLLIQDLAVALNDWCLNEDSSLNAPRISAMISGYESVRPLLDEEHQSLPAMQRVSAARFALTRFESGDPPLKDPGQMIRLASWLI